MFSGVSYSINSIIMPEEDSFISAQFPVSYVQQWSYDAETWLGLKFSFIVLVWGYYKNSLLSKYYLISVKRGGFIVLKIKQVPSHRSQIL